VTCNRTVTDLIPLGHKCPPNGAGLNGGVRHRINKCGGIVVIHAVQQHANCARRSFAFSAHRGQSLRKAHATSTPLGLARMNARKAASAVAGFLALRKAIRTACCHQSRSWHVSIFLRGAHVR
jgi:hypothetical protein